MPDVFISYSRKDKSLMQQLHSRLDGMGRDVWVDWEDIPLTADWWQEIRSGIESADTFVFIMTPNSMSSPVCNLEVLHAAECGKRIIPVVHIETNTDETTKYLEGLKPDELLRGMLKGRNLAKIARDNVTILGHINWVFFREQDNFDEAFNQLTSIIDTDIDYVREHTRLLIRAREWQDSGHNASFLLDGEEFRVAEQWLVQATGKEPEPTELHTEFIYKSGSNERSKQRRLLIGVSVAMVIAIALSVLSFVFFLQARSSEEEALAKGTEAALAANAAETSESVALARGTEVAEQAAISEQKAKEAQSIALAANAQLLNDSDQTNALAMALYAMNIDEPPLTARRTLLDVGLAPGPAHAWLAHKAGVSSIAFSPDGLKVLSTSCGEIVDGVNCEHGEMILWDLVAGGEAFTIEAHTDFVSRIVFSEDGSQIFSAGCNEEQEDGTCIASDIIVWDAETGEEVTRLSGQAGLIWDIALSPSGQHVLAGSDDGSLALWDIQRREQVQTFEQLSERIRSVAISPDGRTAISGTEEGTVTAWGMRNGEQQWSEQQHGNQQGAAVNRIVFDANGTQVYTASEDRTIISWDLMRGLRLNHFEGHKNGIADAAMSPYGTWLVTASADTSLIVWDNRNGLPRYFFNDHAAGVTAVAFHPTRDVIVSGSNDGTIVIWTLEQGEVLQSMLGHEAAVFASEFSPDGKYALTGSYDTSMILWDVETGEQVRQFAGHNGWVMDVDFNSDGSLAASASAVGKVRLWDVETGEQIHQYSGHNDRVNSVVFTSDDAFLLTGSSDGTMFLTDVETGEVVQQYMAYEEDEVTAIALNDDDSLILSGSSEGALLLWDRESGEVIQTFEDIQRLITSVDFSPDGKYVLSSSSDKTIAVWYVETGELYRLFTEHDVGVSGAVFSEDSQFIYAGLWNNTLIIWNIEGLQQIYEFTGTNGNSNSVAFSADGRRAITDVIVRIMGQPGEEPTDVILVDVWNTDYDELVEWVCQNRYIIDLSQIDRETYNVTETETVCDS